MPSPPLMYPSESAASTPCSRQCASTASRSRSLSAAKRFSATTAGAPQRLMFARCRSRLGKPASHRAIRRSSLGAERLQRHDHDRRGRHVAAHRHHEIEELLGAEIGGKAGLVHDVVGQVQTDSLGQHAAGAVRDVRERTAMHDRRHAFGGLHQVGQDGVVQQHHHRTDRLEVAGNHRPALGIEADDNLARGGDAGLRGSRTSDRIAMISDAAVITNPVSRAGLRLARRCQ